MGELARLIDIASVNVAIELHVLTVVTTDEGVGVAVHRITVVVAVLLRSRGLFRLRNRKDSAIPCNAGHGRHRRQRGHNVERRQHMNRCHRRNCIRRQWRYNGTEGFRSRRATGADLNIRWIAFRSGSCNRFGAFGWLRGSRGCSGLRWLRRRRGFSCGRGLCLLGSLHADKGRGSVECDRHKQDGDEDTTPSTGESLAERAVVEQPLNAARETTGTSHGDSYSGWARCCREFKKDLRIRGAAGSLLQSGAIADGFGQVGECSLEPPAERAEPDQRRIKRSKQLQVEIALSNVRALMGEHN